MTVFEAYITNLGKYAEGQLVGETLKFPATTEEVQSLLKNIGVDGVRYEEFFITAFDGDVMGLYDYLTEYENLDELNHLAHLISELDSDEIETLEAVLNKGDHTSSVADIINLVHNLDCYELHPGVTDDETLGRIYVEDMELLDVPDNVLPYFDFEAYGRDMRINEGGHFAPTGYLTRSGDFKEVYHGIEDIPAEHRIFAYPKLNIREQMAAYREQHQSDFILAESAIRYFKAHGITKLPASKALQREIEQLTVQKNAGYNDYREKRERVRQLQTVKGNIDQILRREPSQQKKHEQER